MSRGRRRPREARSATAKARTRTPRSRKRSREAHGRKRRAAHAAAPRTLDEFMAQALAMEVEAAQRYAEFADAMEMHNNLEVAALFRKMADIEGKHATADHGGDGLEDDAGAAPGHGDRGTGFEAPETAPGDEVHYLMQPYHALELALANEERAERFFARARARRDRRVGAQGRARAAGRGARARRARPGVDEEGAEARRRLGERPRPAALHRLGDRRCRDTAARRLGAADRLRQRHRRRRRPHRVHRRAGRLGRAAEVPLGRDRAAVRAGAGERARRARRGGRRAAAHLPDHRLLLRQAGLPRGAARARRDLAPADGRRTIRR